MPGSTGCVQDNVKEATKMNSFNVYGLLKFTLYSRLVLLVCQVIFNWAVQDYDSSTQVSKCTVSMDTDNCHVSVLDFFVCYLFDGFRKWDAAYFLYITQFGYQYEQMLAFFPGFPLVIRQIGTLLRYILFQNISSEASFLVVGFIINIVLFTINVFLLLTISEQLKFQKQIAILSGFLYAINPASIFMSANYSETLFTICQFGGLYFLTRKNDYTSFVGASIFFGLSGFVRSNGVISVGFLIHNLLSKAVCFISRLLNTNLWKENAITVLRQVFYLLPQTCSALLAVVPFVLTQYQAYHWYCFQHNDTMSSSRNISWCLNPIPLAYSSIQLKYWNVGFLNYYQLKQLPNFLLATPICLICVLALIRFCCQGKNYSLLYTLGLFHRCNDKSAMSLQHKQHDFFTNPQVVVYWYHLAFLLSFGILTAHVQILTRLICSSSPVVYWFCATVIWREMQSKRTDMLHTKMLLFFFIAYFFLGILLHSNFFPWT